MDTMPTGPNIAAGRLAQWSWGWWWHWRMLRALADELDSLTAV
jgi:hypothetical protein